MNPEEEVVVPAEEVVEQPAPTPEAPAEEVEETVEEVKARLAKAEELANNYKVRAEKAEKRVKEAPAPTQDSISSTDQVALAAAIAKGTVDEDDIERVQKFAKLEGISIKEALKHDDMKALLAVSAEKRKTASAANVNNVRRGPAKVTDDVLLDRAAKGILPDSDEDIARLIAAKTGKK